MMDNFLNFMSTQWPNILTLLGLLGGLFVIIAKWTPTPKDDLWAARIMGWLNMLPVSAKEKLADDTAAKKP
jgi:hypothetical protein